MVHMLSITSSFGKWKLIVACMYVCMSQNHLPIGHEQEVISNS